MILLAKETHKFESRYLDNLIGAYPQEEGLYAERSPVRHADSIKCPLLIMQGTEDKVVPPDQAVEMNDALVASGVPVGLVLFAGEGHGWRRADTIQRAMDLEINFYGQIFGFTPDVVCEVPIVFPVDGEIF